MTFKHKNTIIGIIPARSGSKEYPLKTSKKLAGKPLIAYTADAALNSKYLHRTILSTDSNEIAEIGRFLRSRGSLP